MFMSNLFKNAIKEGVSPVSVLHTSIEKTSIDIFNGEVEQYVVANDGSIKVQGIYKGKLGSFISDRTDGKISDLVIKSLINSAEYGKEADPDLFVSPKQVYKRNRGFNKDCEKTTANDLIALGQEINKTVHALDKRITVCEVQIEKQIENRCYQNSNQVKAKGKTNLFMIYCFVNIAQGEEIESADDYEILSDIAKFDANAFGKKLAEKAESKLGAETIPSGKYNVVFNPQCVSMLIHPLLNMLSSYMINHHQSLFEGQFGKQVLSKKLTIKENPWTDNVFASSFDDEGVPTRKKTLIEKGVIKNFIYDISEARKEGLPSSGNGNYAGNVIHPGLGYVSVKKGVKDLDDLCQSVHNGLFIDSLEGIGTGLSPQSGDYSLQANGYLIEDGKITKPVTLITVAGNLLKDFKNVIGVSNDMKLTFNKLKVPSIAIRKLSVSGK